MIGLGTGPTFRRGRSELARLIAALFGNDEAGGLWLPGPTTCWTDVNRTIPAGVGDTVAFMDDLKDGAKFGPELVSNGTFDTDTAGWEAHVSGDVSISAVDGVARFTVSTTTATGAVYMLSLTAGRTYRLSGRLRRRSGTGEVSLNVINNAQTAFVLQNNLSDAITSSAFVEKTYSFVATETNNRLYVRHIGHGTGSVEFDDISVQELPGNHATQATAGARPALGRTVEGGRRNLLTHTEDLTNAVWSKAGYTGGVFEGNTALYETEADETHAIGHSFGPTDGETYSRYADLKPIGRRYIVLSIRGFPTAAPSGILGGNHNIFDTQSGAFLSDNDKWSAEDKGDGFFRLGIIDTAGSSDNNRLAFYATDDAGGANSFLGDPSKGIAMRASQFQLSPTATPYQRVGASALDVTEAGKKELWYLNFDGVDDFLPVPGFEGGTRFSFVRSYDSSGASMLALHLGHVGSSPWFGVAVADDTSTTLTSGFEQHSLHVNSVLSTATTRGGQYALLNGNKVDRWDMTASATFADLSVGHYPDFPAPEQVFALCTRHGTLDAEQAARIDAHFASRSGVTL